MSRTKNDPYGAGLDADGYPIEHDPWLGKYRPGYEGDAGDFNPIGLGAAVANVFDRAVASIQIGDNTESPIEQQLGAAVWMFFERQKNPLKLCLMVDFNNAPDELLLVPQYSWSFYRSDWAIFNPKRAGGLLIECDGKEFHSAPEHRAHDRKKDQAALDRGYITLRFSGSEIFRDADGCAKKIYEAVCGG